MRMELLEKAGDDLHALKGIAHKNVAEKVLHAKLQRQIDRQQRAFEKEHCKNENELKLILQRLQLEQQILDPDEEQISDEEPVETNLTDSEEDEGVINPYPVLIMPKFAQNQKTNKSKGGKQSRRKSLEYEDVDKIKSSGMRTTLLAASFISKLRSPFHRKTTSVPEQEQEESWSDHWEATASIRRPRKTVAEQNQLRMLQRAKSDLHCLSPTGSTCSVQTPRKHELSRLGSRKDEVPSLGNLHYEGTIEDGSLSPRLVGRPKSRRGGSLKEKKSSTLDDDNDNDSVKMRRCHSTKERRKTNKNTGKVDSNIHVESTENQKVPSRKNSMEKKAFKRHGHEPLSRKGSKETDNHPPSPSAKHAHQDHPKSFREKHARQGSLKERGEMKGKKETKSRMSSLNKFITSMGSKSSVVKQKSLSTDSSPIESPSPSHGSKDKKFRF